MRWRREQRKLRLAAARAPQEPSAPPAGVTVPAELPVEQRAVWEALAPHARAAGTLTEATALAFRELCEWIAVKQALYADLTERGGTKYRGMVALVSGGLARFRLNPDGKPAAAPAQPEDPFAEFDGPHLVKKGA